jgi:alpha-glucosidase/alpha-D-xyloside xylohydrolase
MTRNAAVAAGIVLVSWVVSPATTADVRYRGARAELSVSAVSDHTVQIVLAPLDDKGRPRPAPPSTALVEQKPKLALRCRELAQAREVSVGKLRVQVKPDPLTVSVRGPGGKLVQEFTLTADNDGAMSFRTGAVVLGMGEGAHQFDRRGVTYSMRDGWGGWNRPILGSWIAVPFLIGTDGWAFFVHHPWGQFDLRGRQGQFKPAATPRDVPLELYVIAWDRPADVLKEHRRLTGATPLPPRWALGFMQSHRTLAGPDEVLEVARTFRDKKLPCDALIYLGTGYCPAGWNTGHGSLAFNPKTFDRPADIIKQLHKLNFRVILHKNRALRNLHGLSVDPKQADDPSSIASYWKRHQSAFALGVDGWWPDDGDELPREARLARHRTYHDGPLRDRPNVRPWSLHRTGYTGAHRYGGWIWSGDIDSRWETLAAQVSVGQNHSLSLSPYWGTDIGGFYPTKELTGELYVRWFQFAAFCPSFRAHGRTWHLRLPWGWNTGKFGPLEHRERPDAAELRNAQVEPICRKYLELRYQLLSYNYTLCREAHDTALPLIRALWLHYPNDPKAVARGDQYLWGRDLLVAPVTKKGAVERTLYLPEGTWYDFWSNARLAGGAEVTRKVDLATLPLYVRAGAILPLEPPRLWTAQPADDRITIRIYPGRDGEFRWYADDGASLDYQKGKYAWTRLSWDDGKRRLTIEPDASSGTFEPGPRTLVIEVVGTGKSKKVRYEGRRVEVAF